MRICAFTHEKQNMPRAMHIAFEIYDRMTVGRIKPSPIVFELMYVCVRNFLDQHPEEEKQGLLLQKVFEAATKHGITKSELVKRHRELMKTEQSDSFPT